MRRKIIKQGGGAYTITLPVEWIRSLNLAQGDEVEIINAGTGLYLDRDAKLEKKEINAEIDVKNKDFTRISLNNLYRLGYDRIKLTINDKSDEHFLSELVDTHLLGFEVIEKKEKYAIIESVSEPTGEQQKVLLKRMIFIIKETLQILSNDFKMNKFPNMEDIRKNTYKVDKYMNFCRRNIFRKRFVEEKGHFYWSFYSYLGLFQHSLFHLYEYLSKEMPKIGKNGATIFNEIFSNFNIFTDYYLRKDIKEVEKINFKNKTLLYNKIQKNLKNSNDCVVAYYMGELSRIMYIMSSPVLGILFE